MTIRKLPIFHLSFPNQYLAAATCMRFQEHYESPHYCGKTFSLEEFMDWYARTYGNFTYTSDWSGFNFPSATLDAFHEGKFDPLTRKESKLLSLFKRRRSRFYVIGTHRKSDAATLAHECVHGLFFVFPDYSSDVLHTLKAHDTKRLKRHLRKMGYARHVLNDEINAYLTTGLEKGMGGPEVQALQIALRRVYSDHFEGDIADPKERRRLIRSIHTMHIDMSW